MKPGQIVVSVLAALFCAAPAASEVSFEWITVSAPGNACDPQGIGRCFGAVDYTYRIARHEVANAQYVEFLNAKAASDPLGLYNTEMGTWGGIARSGSPGSYTYSAIPGRENHPVNNVSYFDALRFINWLHNGQGSGDTETGAYTLQGGTATPSNTLVERNPGATIFLPTDAEWYKAAYYDPLAGVYYDYPAGTDAQIVGSAPTATPNRANCAGAAGDFTDVGSYTGSPSPNGTFDQGGNVSEWCDFIVTLDHRPTRGGTLGSAPQVLRGAVLEYEDPTFEWAGTGFRVASPAEVMSDCNGNGTPDSEEPDSDGDGVIDACDGCPSDGNKAAPGACGCGIADTDSDGEGTPDCFDGCPTDPNKTEPGVCGCGVADTDSDNDTVLDCNDQCPGGDDRLDCDGDGTPDACDPDVCEDAAIILMVFNTATNIPGVGSVTDEDVVAYDTGTQTWSLYFDGSDVGLSGFAIDALARLADGSLIFSFTTAGTIGGVGSDDSDLLRFVPASLGATTAGAWSMYFDGSDVALTQDAEDIDAAQVLADGRILISTEGSVSVPGVSANDEDIIVFTPTSLGPTTSGTWAMSFDGSDVGLEATKSGEDVDALCVTPLGTLLLSTLDAFSVPGVSGGDEDIFEFTPTALGFSTAGMYRMFLDLSSLGIATDVVGLEVLP
jgi:formylglycine-generating enzyme required for sulfatase activity